MLIHQITDLHVPDEGSTQPFGDVKANVERQLRYIDSARPDLLVISGDLTMIDRSEEACNWIKSRLPDVPCIVIPGNHDDPAMIARIFGQWPTRADYDDCSLIFADSSPDTLPDDQFELFRVDAAGQRCVLFIHHPPHLIGSGFMTLNQPLRNYAEVAHALSESAISHVFCGHYHNAAHVQCGGFDLFLTPSPAFQIALDEPAFTAESFKPAVRTIAVSASKVKSELIEV